LVEVYAEGIEEAIEAWEEVRGEEANWGEFRVHVTQTLKWYVESSLRDAVSRKIGVSWYARSDGRTGYRNGSYIRTLVTPYGTVEVEVPRLREGSYEHKLWDKNGLLTAEARELILETYLAGASTRRTCEVLERVLGYKVSPSTVSSICKGLDRLVKEYWHREIGDEWRYLTLDGVVMKSRAALGVEKRVVLVARGISLDGRKEILSFKQAESESEACWTTFVEDLAKRGLEGKNLELVATDGNAGLIAAVEGMWPRVSRQRCWVHKLANMAAKMKRCNQKNCLGEAKLIYLAQSRAEAIRRFRSWRAKWKEVESKAVACLEADIQEMLEFLYIPEKDRVTMRTTNPIERVFREVRRRTRTISCFTNRRSVDRMVYAVLAYQNRKWDSAHRRPTHFTHKT